MRMANVNINQTKQKKGFDQSFLNDSSYLYSYPIKIPKPENHTSERNQYSLNKLVQIYENSDGKYIDANKKIIKNEDVYMVSSPDNDADSMNVYFFTLDEIIHYRKNHEKSSDGISCRFSLKFNNEEQINQINLIDVLDKNCFYKNAYDRHVPYTSLYKILCIKTGKEYLMTSSLSAKENDANNDAINDTSNDTSNNLNGTPILTDNPENYQNKSIDNSYNFYFLYFLLTIAIILLFLNLVYKKIGGKNLNLMN